MTATTEIQPSGFDMPRLYGSPMFDESPFETTRTTSHYDRPGRPQQVVPDPMPQQAMSQQAMSQQSMSQQPMPQNAMPYRSAEQRSMRSRLDQTRFWVGATITAAIAAVTAVLGTIVAHSILHIPVLSDGAGGPHTLAYALSAAGIAFAAAGLYNAMVHFAPRPRAFFGALSGALIALAVLVPFAVTLPLGTQAAFALMNLAVAGVIAILVPFAATNARR
jgi:hypothetical protein